MAPMDSDPPRGPVGRLAQGLAFGGGLALLGAAGLTTTSVLRRWLTNQPIPGDFELVSLGAGIAVLGFLAHGTLMRANILVDSFTTWLPRSVTARMDGVWMLVWAGVAALLAERLWVGAREMLASGTTTMVLGLPVWWAVGIGALGFLATALAALAWSWRLLRGRG